MLYKPIVRKINATNLDSRTIFFLVVEYTGYVFYRKHRTFKEQRRFIFSHKFLMLGFGTGVMGVLAVPFLQFFCIPLGVVGATRLWYDTISRSNSIEPGN